MKAGDSLGTGRRFTSGLFICIRDQQFGHQQVPCPALLTGILHQGMPGLEGIRQVRKSLDFRLDVLEIKNKKENLNKANLSRLCKADYRTFKSNKDDNKFENSKKDNSLFVFWINM